jgi:AcrR family transcriptional regulator
MVESEVSSRPLRVDAERNLRRLLDAAAQAFAERGLGVSVDEIARRAGVGKGTVFRRFPTKEHLVAEIVCDRLEQITAQGAALLEAELPGEALLEFMRAGTRVQAQDRGFLEAAAGVVFSREEVIAAHKRFIAVAASLLERAQSAGAIRADVAPCDVMLIECAASQAGAMLHSAAPEAWRRYLDIFFDGLRPGAAHPLSHPPPTEEQLARAKRDHAEAAIRRRR